MFVHREDSRMFGGFVLPCPCRVLHKHSECFPPLGTVQIHWRQVAGVVQGRGRTGGSRVNVKPTVPILGGGELLQSHKKIRRAPQH